MPFKTEQQLFEVAITNPLMETIVGAAKYQTYAYAELKGLFGIPDLVVVNFQQGNESSELLRSFAFEMKLSNWKRALVQSFRYRAFANLVYVVIDRHFVKPALTNIDRFIKSNIGLISIDQSGNLFIHYRPEFDKPYSYKLEEKFHMMIGGEGNKVVNKMPKLMVWDSGFRPVAHLHFDSK